jgi:hypothetical protein
MTKSIPPLFYPADKSCKKHNSQRNRLMMSERVSNALASLAAGHTAYTWHPLKHPLDIPELNQRPLAFKLCRTGVFLI